MKFKINSKYVKWGITAFFVIAAAICGIPYDRYCP